MKLLHSKIAKRTRNDCWKSIRFVYPNTTENVWNGLDLVDVLQVGVEKPIYHNIGRNL